VVLADGVYGTKENRNFLKAKGIHFEGKPLGRPKKQMALNAEEIKKAKAQRKLHALKEFSRKFIFGPYFSDQRLSLMPDLEWFGLRAHKSFRERATFWGNSK